MSKQPDNRDFVGEVIAEDNEARKLRTIGEQVKNSDFKHWDVWLEFNGVVALSVTAGGVMDNYDKDALQAMIGEAYKPAPAPGEQVKRVPRVSDDPAVRLAECRGEAVAFDEEAERALYEAWAHRRAVVSGYQFMAFLLLRNDDGSYRTCWVDTGWDAWSARAKSRAGVV